MSIKVFVAGLENSGNHWVHSILSQHPDLEVSITSFPCEWGEKRCYPYPLEAPDTMVIVCRDSTCQRRGVIRRGYETGNEGKFTNEESIQAILSVASLTKRKVVFVSYETLVRYRDAYLKWLFWEIGVDPVEVKTEFRDENIKYMRDEPVLAEMPSAD
jgi:hypothetical protein